jgi:hypothetical protein
MIRIYVHPALAIYSSFYGLEKFIWSYNSVLLFKQCTVDVVMWTKSACKKPRIDKKNRVWSSSASKAFKMFFWEILITCYFAPFKINIRLEIICYPL